MRAPARSVSAWSRPARVATAGAAVVVLLLATAFTLAATPGRALAQDSEAAAQASIDSRPAALLGRTGLPLPRFVSLRAGEVNLRAGPGLRYPIEWVYNRRNLPVEIIDEFDTWRRIRDWEGTEGWVHQSMLQGDRTLRVTGETRALRSESQDAAQAVALVEDGAIGRIQACSGRWCQASFGDYEGWLRRDEFFGTYPHETFE